MADPKSGSPPRESTVDVWEAHTNGGPAKLHLGGPSVVLADKLEVTGQPAKHLEIVRLQGLYAAEDWDTVIEFLSAHLALTLLLLDAHPRLCDIFAGSQSVQLRLVPGYEEDEPASLFADVMTTADPMLAFAQMNRFEDEWWLDAMTPAEGLLHFSVEFA